MSIVEGSEPYEGYVLVDSVFVIDVGCWAKALYSSVLAKYRFRLRAREASTYGLAEI
ncbi:hypothetical protein ACGE24_06155 [Corynebacterium kroppenstedtii]|uniref:hypothetical protein n=1 Tax=Corynebacterium sp. PCR 32 TaxID=3351342 RepID=UPI0030A783CA